MNDHVNRFLFLIALAFFSRLAMRFVDAKIENDTSIANDTRRAADALEVLSERK